ncbi:hypothetical protein OJAV_G00101480 [Oryzias javanicus]|uniref:Uncharacterized protein n=1 Tax=Oryzias javanicus TaxID=123683 RepID=A0A3S2MUQ5_ORYJA|nr:hypothetical protein OJAV_G00101480 [Oryzias javanicus]
MAVQVCLSVSFFALLVVGSFGLPLKGSKSTDQSSSDTHDSSYYASNPRVASDYPAPVHYGTARIMSQPVQFFLQEPGLSHEAAEAAPALGSMSSATAEDFYSSGSDSSVQAEQGADSTQPEVAQPGMPEARWLVPPQSFEEASIDAQAQSTSELLPQPPLPPAGPVLQSGETSNVVKEAELGNYQQQTEEFGYPADFTESQQSSTNMVLPSVVLPGYWGNPYPGFDYRLLYGLNMSLRRMTIKVNRRSSQVPHSTLLVNKWPQGAKC